MPTSIEVSIPVKLGGYTGQRDQWEEGEHNYTVKYGVGTVTLESAGSVQQRITFQLDDLNEAIDFIKTRIKKEGGDGRVSAY